MPSIKQDIQTDLLVWQRVASGAQAYSSYNLDCRDKRTARIGVYFGLDSATVPVGTQILILSSDKDSGNDDWAVADSIITPTVAPTAFTIDANQAAGTGAVGSPILTDVSVPVVGDVALFANGADILNSEIVTVVNRVVGGGNDSITLRYALSKQQNTGITYYTQAQIYQRNYDVTNMRRLTVVVNNNYAASSPSCVIRVSLVTVFGRGYHS